MVEVPVTGETSIDNLHADFMVGMHAWRNVHVHADVQILELSVHQGVDARGANADARLEAARGDRHAVAHAKFRRLPVNGANFRVLNNFGVRVRQKGVGGNARAASRCSRCN